MNKKLGCSVTDEDKKLLDKLTKESNKNQGELIGYLLRSYDQLSNRKPVISLEAFNLSGSEQLEVENALTNSNSQLDEVARDGLLQRSRYLNSIANNQAKLESMTLESYKNLSEKDKNKVTFKGAANHRIEQAIEILINHNNNQSEKSQKVCITKGMVFRLTGSNRQTISKYFNEHEVMISDHNNKHNLTDIDNRKGKGFSFEQLLGVE